MANSTFTSNSVLSGGAIVRHQCSRSDLLSHLNQGYDSEDPTASEAWLDWPLFAQGLVPAPGVVTLPSGATMVYDSSFI